MSTTADLAPTVGAEVRHFQIAPPPGDLGERAHAAARQVLGTHGIVRHCRRFPAVASLPTLPVYVARGPRRGFGGRDAGFDVVGMGVAQEADDAWLKAVVEAVERYCFAWPHDPSVVVRAPFGDVEEDAVPLPQFLPFTPAQYRSRPSLHVPGPDDPLDWTWAWSLTSHRFALVPAAAAYASVGFRPPNNFDAACSSTGVATHVSVEAAALAGLLEVVERDAVMIHWLNAKSPARITLDGDAAGEEIARLLAEHFALPDVEMTLLDLTADSGIPTVCCLATSMSPSRPAAAFGSAARPQPLEAARKAVFETAQVFCGLHGRRWDSRSTLAQSEVRDIWDHARFYAGSAGAGPMAFMRASAERVRLDDMASCGTGDPGGDLRRCVERLAGVGLEVLVVDLTPADVAACGLRTVKVLVPGMVDINGDARHPQLGRRRAHTVPAALGWPPRGQDELNLAPGPLS